MKTLIDYFVAGGLLMWPILFCSVLTWAIMLERAIRLRRSRLIDDALADEVEAALTAGKLDRAEELGKDNRCLASRVVANSIHGFRHAAPDFRTALEENAGRELTVLWDHMVTLNTTGRVAILIGLLGTVIGMVDGFRELSAGGVDKGAVADAISVALLTTVGGLCVAIPAIVGEAAIRGRIRRLTAAFEAVFDRMLNAAAAGGGFKQ